MTHVSETASFVSLSENRKTRRLQSRHDVEVKSLKDVKGELTLYVSATTWRRIGEWR